MLLAIIVTSDHQGVWNSKLFKTRDALDTYQDLRDFVSPFAFQRVSVTNYSSDKTSECQKCQQFNFPTTTETAVTKRNVKQRGLIFKISSAVPSRLSRVYCKLLTNRGRISSSFLSRETVLCLFLTRFQRGVVGKKRVERNRHSKRVGRWSARWGAQWPLGTK